MKALKQNAVARSLAIFLIRLCPAAGASERTFATHKKSFHAVSHFKKLIALASTNFPGKKETPTKQQQCIC